MSTTDLKLHIINKIAAIEDELILEEIYKLLDMESGTDSFYTLTTEERKAIDVGVKDIKENRVYSSEVADNIIKEWLRK
jgi:hypothetical protein